MPDASRGLHHAAIPAPPPPPPPPLPPLFLLHLAAASLLVPHRRFTAATERVRAGTLRPEDAHHLFDELLRQTTPVPQRFLNAFLSALAHAPASYACRDGPVLAVALVNRVRQDEAGPRVTTLSVHTYNILMDCCCHARRPDLGIAIFGRLLRMGLKTSQITANVFLKCLCYAKQTDEAVDMLLHRMSDLGRSPDVVAYSTVINALCTEGEVSKACSLFHQMMQQGVVPNVVTYSSIIDALCKARAMDKAELFLRQMVDNGIQPDKVTYTIMIHGYSSLGQWREASKMFREMTSQGLIPDVVTWYSFKACLRKHGRNKEAADIFESMTAKGHMPIYIYT